MVVATSPAAPPARALKIPRECTFAPGDWEALTHFWYPVAYVDEIPADKPIARVLLDERLVLYRAGDKVVAAKDLCIHRGSPLSMGWVEGEELVCAYHGFRYAPSGQCTRVPAQPHVAIPPKLCMQVFATAVRYGIVWVCLSGQPRVPLPEWPEPTRTDLKHLRLPPQDWRCSVARQVENFNDVSHLSWVHVDTFGNREAPEVARYAVEETEHGLSFDCPYTFVADRMQNNGNRTSSILYNYRLWFPFYTKLTLNFQDGKHYYLFDVPSPVSARHTRIFFLMAQDYDHDSSPDAMIAFQTKVLNEDRPVVEGQRPEEIPLDLTEEFHIRADRFSTHFRQALQRFGLRGELSA